MAIVTFLLVFTDMAPLKDKEHITLIVLCIHPSHPPEYLKQSSVIPFSSVHTEVMFSLKIY